MSDDTNGSIASESYKHPQILLLSHPKSCSNLLLRILNLAEQPAIHSDDKHPWSGYMFMPVAKLYKDEHILKQPIAAYSPELRQKIEAKCASCYDDLEGIRKRATEKEMEGERGLGVFNKEHLQLIIHPAAIDKYVFRDEQPKNEGALRATESGKSLFWNGAPIDECAHNHTLMNGKQAPTNPNDTLFSSAYLRQWTPILLIRDPVVAWPKLWRSQLAFNINPDEDTDDPDRQAENLSMLGYREWWTTMRWHRRFVEWWVNDTDSKSNGTASSTARDAATTTDFPITIIDAGDLLNAPEEYVTKLALRVGLDPGHLKFSWPEATAEEVEKMEKDVKVMTTTLRTSTGVNKPSPTGDGEEELNIDEEVKKWRAEFGEKATARLEHWVRDSVEDYAWLRQRRMRC